MPIARSVVLSLVLWVAVALPAFAQDDAAARAYDKRHAAVLDHAADRLWASATSAEESRLHLWAEQVAERVILLDPDHGSAREYLGFVHESGEWIRYAGTERREARNTRVPGITDAKHEKNQAAWQSLRDKTQSAVAVDFAKLGASVNARRPDLALRAFHGALRWDPDNAQARKALGYTRAGETWTNPPRTAARKAAAKGVAVQDKSPWDDALGMTLTKQRTPHFVLETVYADEAGEIVQTLETMTAYYRTLIGLEPEQELFPEPVRVYVLRTDGEWEKLMRSTFPSDWTNRLGRDREYSTAEGWVACSAWSVDAEGPPLSTCVSVFSRLLLHHTFKTSKREWLDDGLTYHLLAAVLDRPSTYGVPSRQISDIVTPARGPLWKSADEFVWRGLVQEAVVADRVTPLSGLLSADLDSLPLHDSLKSWSVVDWLLATQREGFLEVLRGLRASEDDGSLLEEHLGANVEELDRQWRAFVLSTY